MVGDDVGGAELKMLIHIVFVFYLVNLFMCNRQRCRVCGRTEYSNHYHVDTFVRGGDSYMYSWTERQILNSESTPTLLVPLNPSHLPSYTHAHPVQGEGLHWCSSFTRGNSHWHLEFMVHLTYKWIHLYPCFVVEDKKSKSQDAWKL